MRPLYRLQQRLAVTPAESTALLTLAFLFLLGLGAQRLQRRPPPPDDAVYAAADALFAEAAADSLASDPVTPDAAPADTAHTPGGGAAGRLDLNRATAAALDALPRIGPATAARIIDHRTAHGPFRRVEDLTEVRGIGEKTLAAVAPFVYVGEGGGRMED